VQVNYAKTVLPAIIIGYLLPTLSFSSFVSTNYLTTYPIAALTLTYLTHLALSSFVSNTTHTDRIHNPYADLPSLHLASRVITAISAFSSIYTLFSTSFSVLSTTQPILFIPALIWLVLLFVDLKKAGMLDASEAKSALLLAASTAMMGPGATVVTGWMWREELLATRRHKGAVVEN
jgi:hypothetical protein